MKKKYLKRKNLMFVWIVQKSELIYIFDPLKLNISRNFLSSCSKNVLSLQWTVYLCNRVNWYNINKYGFTLVIHRSITNISAFSITLCIKCDQQTNLQVIRLNTRQFDLDAAMLRLYANHKLVQTLISFVNSFVYSLVIVQNR